MPVLRSRPEPSDQLASVTSSKHAPSTRVEIGPRTGHDCCRGGTRRLGAAAGRRRLAGGGGWRAVVEAGPLAAGQRVELGRGGPSQPGYHYTSTRMQFASAIEAPPAPEVDWTVRSPLADTVGLSP